MDPYTKQWIVAFRNWAEKPRSIVSNDTVLNVDAMISSPLARELSDLMNAEFVVVVETIIDAQHASTNRVQARSPRRAMDEATDLSQVENC